MSNEILGSLLREYEQKKLIAEINLDKRKQDLFKKFPRLQQIENELATLAISASKNVLLHNSGSDNLNEKLQNLKREKDSILQNANLPSDYLKPNYECPICNDTGYVMKDNNSQMCSCLKQKLLDISFNKSNISNLDKENFDTFNSNLFSDEIDLAKYRFNISPKRNIEIIKKKCMDFVNNFDNPNYNNLLFTGNTGLRQNFYVKLYC